MKKILQRCMAGLLTALLCSGGVYGAEEPTTITLADALNAATTPITFTEEGTSQNTHVLGSQKIDWGEDGDDFNGVVYNLGLLTEGNTILCEFFIEDYDDDMYYCIYYQGDDADFINNCPVVPGTGSIYDLSYSDKSYSSFYIDIPADGTWYVYIDDDGAGITGEMTVDFTKSKSFTIDEALANAQDAAFNTTYSHKLGSQLIHENNYTHPGTVYKLGQLDAGDCLIAEYEYDYDKYYIDAGFIVFYQESDNETINSLGDIYADDLYELPHDGIYYIAFLGYYTNEVVPCEVTFTLIEAEDIDETLEFTAETADAVGENWSWDKETKTLNLYNGFSITVYDGDGIELPDGATVNVNGNVSITTYGDDGIDGDGKLTINLAEGAHLTIDSDDDAIYVEGDLEITGDDCDNSKITITSTDDAMDSEGNIQLKNVHVDATTEYSGIYTYVDSTSENTGGHIKIENCIIDIDSYDDGICVEAYETVEDIVIDITGSDVTINTRRGDDGEGIYALGSIKILESSIDVNANEESIYSSNDIIIGYSTLTLISEDDQGIQCSDNADISNSSINIPEADDEGIEVGDKLTLTNCTVTTNVDEESFEVDELSITGGTFSLRSRDGDAPVYLNGIDDINENSEMTTEEKIEALKALYAAKLSSNVPLTTYVVGGTIDFRNAIPLYNEEDNDVVWSTNGDDVIDFEVTTDPEPTPKPEPEEPDYEGPPMPFLLSLNVQVGEGGSANASGSLLIAKYATRNLRFTADEGYEIADVLVNGKSVGAVSSYKVGPATANTTVEVRFAPIPVEEAPVEAAE